MQSLFKIICLSGSLRKNSCNTGVLRYIVSLASSFSQVQIEIHCLADLPMYNGDIDPTENRTSSPSKVWPESVRSFREKIENADAVILSLSENNGNLSPVLINAISWGSRTEKIVRNGAEIEIQPIMGKKVGLVSVAGRSGGALAQKALRNMTYLKFEFIDLVPGEQLGLNAYQPKAFDENGNLIDEALQEKIKAHVENLVNVISHKK